MLRIYGLILALVLTACSTKEDSPAPMAQSVEAAAQLTLLSGDPNFGEPTASKTVIFSIRNTGTTASEIPTPTLAGANSSAFAIIG